MEEKKELNGDRVDTRMEIKVEPTMQCYVEEENGCNGLDNSSTLTSIAEVGALNLWTSKATTCLISQYKRYRSMVGQSTQIRSLREMFEMISHEMQKFGFYFSPQKCENKWRVLERKYKNLVFRERLKKPGRMRHYGHWEHKRALDEIFHEKRRHMYLEESDFPPPSGSGKYTLILPKPLSEQTAKPGVTASGQPADDPLVAMASNARNPRKVEDNADPGGTLAGMFQKYLTEMEKNFCSAERSKERRHKEKMAMRQSELEVQKKMLKLQEQKMELRKSQLVAAAQHLHLNM